MSAVPIVRASDAPRGIRAARHFLGGFIGLGGRITTWIAHEARVRRDGRRLAEFSDHMLRDIGIARGGLESAVRFGRATEQPLASRKP